MLMRENFVLSCHLTYIYRGMGTNFSGGGGGRESGILSCAIWIQNSFLYNNITGGYAIIHGKNF